MDLFNHSSKNYVDLLLWLKSYAIMGSHLKIPGKKFLPKCFEYFIKQFILNSKVFHVSNF